MKKLVSVILIIFLAGCSGTGDKKAKEKQLEEYKEELSRLKKEISKLEKELAEESGSHVVNVYVEQVKPAEFRHYVDVSGNVNTDKNIVVSPETGGNIVSIDVKEGDKVRKGQILGRLNTEMIERTIKEVQINYELAVTTYNRRKNLWDQNIGSEMEYLQAKSQKESLEQKLESLKAQLDMALIKSPIDGVVDEIIQKTGEIAGPQIPFARVVNLDKLYIIADVSEMYLPQIHKGEEVEISFPVIDKKIRKRIYRVSNVIDPVSRTFRVRVNLNNEDNLIKPNMLAVLKLLIYSNENAIVVPSILIKKDFTGEFIFIAEKEGDRWYARKRYLVTGINNNNQTVVLQGLKEGDALIVKGYAQVVDGAEINPESVKK
ncbi:MAG: efflux RND transporter periplasmic adaptor subunit [Chlorobi bacterium]|nr:efflux RND transporter periplasmic adaptor subunit [Chlorobiota bacterium]